MQPNSPRLLVASGTLGGHAVSRAAFGEFILTDAQYSAGDALPWHAHERASLQFVLEGSNRESFRQRTQECTPFDMTFKPAGEYHRNDYGLRGARCLVVELPEPWLDRVRSAVPTLNRPVFVGGGALAGIMTRIEREVRVADPFTGLALEGFMLEALARAARAPRIPSMSRTPPWLSRARDMLHDQSTAHIDLRSISAAVGINPVHIACVFRRTYGCTPGEYVRRLRVAMARRHLAGSNLTLGQIAVDCGFYDQSHFTRTFKRYTGMTPRQYRAGGPGLQ